MNRSTINLHLGDSLEAMKEYPNNHWDLAICDPPYGMRGNVFSLKTKKFIKEGHKCARIDGNVDGVGLSLSAPPKEEYFDELFRVSKNQIVFGMQYFTQHLPSHQCVIVWDKVNGGSYFSDAEIAYTSFDTAVRIARIHNPSGSRIHPTQKCIKLYEWLLTNYAKEGDKILDTHLGSCSIAIAAHNLCFDLDGWELDADYHAAGVKRFEQHKKQLQLY